jgi:hypothetical protein
MFQAARPPVNSSMEDSWRAKLNGCAWMMLLVTAMPRCSVTSPRAEAMVTGSGSGNCEPARTEAVPSPKSRS